MSSPPTISRVAEAAGVSRATVSRVLNANPTVAPELASRVLEAARELDYAPSLVARSLAIGRTSTVAIVVPDLSNPMFQEVLRGLSNAAAGDGHRLLVAESKEQVGEETVLATEARRRCDGIVLAAPRLPAEEVRLLVARLRPLVLLNRLLPGSDVPSLSVDYAAGIQDILEHLVRLGHRRLAYLSGPSASASNHLRLTALRALAAADDSLHVTELSCGATFDDGYKAADAVVSAGTTAVVAYNDLVAFGALSRLHELRVEVPGQISITGFDDIPFARFTTPPLTTASVPQAELGREAWKRLRDLLRGNPPGHDVHFRPRLQVRTSTGRVPIAT